MLGQGAGRKRPSLAKTLVLRAGGLAVAVGLSFSADAAAQGITATIDRPEATVEDQLVLTVTVEGSRSAQPTLPELVDFDVYPRGQSTQMSFVNGRITSSVGYTYVLVPKRKGTLSIGEVTVELDGEVYRTRPFTVRIVGPDSAPQQKRDLFTTAKLSTTTPYVGQQVIYTWRFFRRVRVGDVRLEPQEFAGFVTEDLGDVREYQTTVNGVQYLVSEIRKALFPQEEGFLTIPESRLRCQVVVRDRRRQRSLFDEFLGATTTETKVLRTREIGLEVRPRPQAPRGYSGLVGEFKIGTKISKTQLQVGESATLDLTVSGTGNVQMIAEPHLPELTSFKIYDDQPTGSVDRSGATLSGYRTFRKALVPLEAGTLTVPSVELTYFEPKSGGYRTARTGPIPLIVEPGEGPEDLRLTEFVTPNAGKVAVRILADDILPLYKGLDAVASRSGGIRSRGVLAAGLLAPPLIFLGTLIANQRRRRIQLDVGFKRRREAQRTARRRLKDIEKQSGSESSAVGRRASRCLREYIGDKLGLEGSALTPAEAADHLRAHRVVDDLADQVRRLLDRLEAAQYGATELRPKELAGEIDSVIKSLERALRGGKAR
jgi:hypothetical protein